MQLAQNVACRTLLLADKYEHIDTMHDDLKLEKLEMRHTYHLSNLCHKNVHCTDNTGIQNLFIRQETRNRLITRNATCNVIVPLIRTTIGHKAVSY